TGVNAAYHPTHSFRASRLGELGDHIDRPRSKWLSEAFPNTCGSYLADGWLFAVVAHDEGNDNLPLCRVSRSNDRRFTYTRNFDEDFFDLSRTDPLACDFDRIIRAPKDKVSPVVVLHS